MYDKASSEAEKEDLLQLQMQEYEAVDFRPEGEVRGILPLDACQQHYESQYSLECSDAGVAGDEVDFYDGAEWDIMMEIAFYNL